jgi:exodeoxyribonuclease V alpha subunit
MAKCEEITGIFDYERNVFGNAGADERTIIGTLDDGTTIKGRAKAGALETGLTYRLYGFWITHPKYGRQFAFQSFTVATPHGQRGTVAYLKRGPNIGTKRALAIWDAFGTNSLEVMRMKPEEVAAKVKGITLDSAKAAAVYFQRLAGLEAVTIELTELLCSRGFPRRLIEEAMGEWGNEAPAAIKANPWVLMKFRGVGFLLCDKLYLELGLPADAIQRQAYCIVHALTSDNEGNTWLSLEKCVDHLAKNIAGGEVRAEEAVAWGIEERLIVKRGGEKGGGKVWLAEWGRASSELRVANAVHGAMAVA